ncbi:unnamed protein product [Parascedosporium putredinis]|uniref:Uncharacterized protein n=1 Tax=Parascedosporium putredinis TaxID=1442378 RepID=A0A9P1H6G7_9PEZI|nr:unnamed protein product [Parascedosporium putredinis]CAI7998805.1 unnamed protein product [Parascedosporium putredinis]
MFRPTLFSLFLGAQLATAGGLPECAPVVLEHICPGAPVPGSRAAIPGGDATPQGGLPASRDRQIVYVNPLEGPPSQAPDRLPATWEEWGFVPTLVYPASVPAPGHAGDGDHGPGHGGSRPLGPGNDGGSDDQGHHRGGGHGPGPHPPGPFPFRPHKPESKTSKSLSLSTKVRPTSTRSSTSTDEPSSSGTPRPSFSSTETSASTDTSTSTVEEATTTVPINATYNTPPPPLRRALRLPALYD